MTEMTVIYLFQSDVCFAFDGHIPTSEAFLYIKIYKNSGAYWLLECLHSFIWWRGFRWEAEGSY